jgi:hypothetical protein
MLLSDVVSVYMANNVGSMLDTPAVAKHLMRAIRQYAGHAVVAALPPLTGQAHSPIPATDDIAANNFDLNLSELSIIRPLFELYCEHANALMLESSRAMGIDPFGRTSSEVMADIKEYELAMPRLCFFWPPELI